MAYILLAIGALMSIAGVYAMVTGYHIVQIEEGWSSVIAGATLLVGGVLVMGLGIIQRTLAQLKTALAARPMAIPALDSIVATPVVAARTKMDVQDKVASPGKIEPQVEDQLRPDRPKRVPIPSLPPSLTPPAIPEPLGVEPAYPEPLKLEPTEPEPARQKPAPPAPPPLVYADPLPSATQSTIHAPDLESAPESTLPAATVSPADPLPADDDYELETPSTPEHDLVAADAVPSVPEPASPHPAPDDDWLDRAFAEFDQDLPKSPAAKTTPPKAPSTKSTLPKITFPRITPAKTTPPAPAKNDPLPEVKPERPPEPEPEAEFEHAYAEPEPVSAEAVEPVPQPPHAPSPIAPPPLPPPHSAAVIGRYESEGTTYVMYADGSIEAHSDAGVYRFASMAELKAFIEN